ncbi:hypothetical protein [Bdellovibrio sp. HCB337]|uniref:hypothetical protein n=1 Tax=Bdellovibrio sp. HCB337 TaxID=3394358 RepID=UPI0039A6DB40
MKQVITSLFLALFAVNAFATSDAHDRVYLVVQNIQSEEFFVERAPIIGCYGLARGPQLVQFTAEYKVTSNIGCGGPVMQDNINALTCANVVDSKESADFMSYSEVTLDISKCAAKNDPKFITMVRTAAKLNFPLKKGEVKLTLIK